MITIGIFKVFFVMKITVALLCEDSSILISSIIDVEINSNFSLDVIISIVTIPCFHFDTIMWYIWKVIIEKNPMSDCGWSRNGSHKWSANFSLHAFFGWSVTVNSLFFDECQQEFS